MFVPTDVSTCAEHAWWEAFAIATRDKTQVLLLHVLPVLTFPWVDEWSLAQPQFEDRIQRDAEQRLQTMTVQSTVPIAARVLWATPRPLSVTSRKPGRASSW